MDTKKPTDISKLFPQWQFALREAAQNLNTNSYPRTDAEIEALNARAKDRINGRNLFFVLKNIFGIPLATRNLDQNYYTVDGFWFALKAESVPDEDERQPVYCPTSNATKSQAAVSFTLYVGKVNADPSYPDWPGRQALVGRDVHLYNAGYSRLRAELAEILDELEAAYQAELPCYEAWKQAEMLRVSDPAVQQDYFLQLIRRGVRRLPTAELLPTPSEPVEVMQAVLEDSIAQMDGLLLSNPDSALEPTLESLTETANRVIALLDELMPSNYDPFDPDDTQDDYSDDDDDLDEEDDQPEHNDDFDLDDGDDDLDEDEPDEDLDDQTEPDTEAIPASV